MCTYSYSMNEQKSKIKCIFILCHTLCNLPCYACYSFNYIWFGCQIKEMAWKMIWSWEFFLNCLRKCWSFLWWQSFIYVTPFLFFPILFRISKLFWNLSKLNLCSCVFLTWKNLNEDIVVSRIAHKAFFSLSADDSYQISTTLIEIFFHKAYTFTCEWLKNCHSILLKTAMT